LSSSCDEARKELLRRNRPKGVARRPATAKLLSTDILAADKAIAGRLFFAAVNLHVADVALASAPDKFPFDSADAPTTLCFSGGNAPQDTSAVGRIGRGKLRAKIGHARV
jgi:hypothetical protein